MKIPFLLILLIISNKLNAQDYCKQVKKEITNLTTFSYASPYDSTSIPPVKITRSYSLDTELAFDNFSISFQLVSDLPDFYVKNPHGEGENDEKKLVIEFDDNTKITDDGVLISYELINEVQLVVRSVYLNLYDKYLDKFDTKKISKYSFCGFSKTLTPDTAAAYKGFIQCIKSTHKKIESGN